MVIYDAICSKHGHIEFTKPMTADWPETHPGCGGELVRAWAGNVPTVVFNAPGFYTTDYEHFERQVGNERAAQFRAERNDIERRAARGQLTGRELSIEGI